MVSFIEQFREKFLQNVLESCPNSTWKIVIMDPFSYKIFNMVSESEELLNLNVKAIEKLHTSRPKAINDIAIYFMLPTKENIDILLSDFNNSKTRRYKEAHLFFLSRVNEKEFKRLSDRVSKYWKTLKELYIDFLPLESKVFSLDVESAFFSLFVGRGDVFDSEVKRITQKLLSVVSTLGEIPIVRYQEMTSSSLGVAKKVALKFQEMLELFIKENPEFLKVKEGSNRPLWIILDRSSDLLTPALHSISYQALINDVLDLKDGRIYKHHYVNGHGEEKSEQVILSEADDLWCELRHHHISDVSEYLLGRLKLLSEKNAAAANLMNRKRRQDSNSDQVSLPSIKEMRDIVAAVPELQMLAKQYSVHINLANQALEILSLKKLDNIIEIEQDLAVGMDCDGKAINNALPLIAPILNDLNVDKYDKLRLMISYILFYHLHPVLPDGKLNTPPSEQNLRRLMEHAGFDEIDRNAIVNLNHLLNNKPMNLPKTPPTYFQSFFKSNQSISNNPINGGLDVEEDLNEENMLALDRSKSMVYKVLNLATIKKLDTILFPFASEKDSAEASAQLNARKGLRVSRPTWQKKKKKRAVKSSGLDLGIGFGLNKRNGTGSFRDNSNNFGLQRSNTLNDKDFGLNNKDDDMDSASSLINEDKPKIILFMTGGMTYSEMRDIAEISRKKHQEILLGSTHVITPKDYVKALKELMNFDFNKLPHVEDVKFGAVDLPSPSPSPDTTNYWLNEMNQSINVNNSSEDIKDTIINREINLSGNQPLHVYGDNVNSNGNQPLHIYGDSIGSNGNQPLHVYGDSICSNGNQPLHIYENSNMLSTSPSSIQAPKPPPRRSPKPNNMINHNKNHSLSNNYSNHDNLNSNISRSINDQSQINKENFNSNSKNVKERSNSVDLKSNNRKSANMVPMFVPNSMPMPMPTPVHFENNNNNTKPSLPPRPGSNNSRRTKARDPNSTLSYIDTNTVNNNNLFKDQRLSTFNPRESRPKSAVDLRLDNNSNNLNQPMMPGFKINSIPVERNHSAPNHLTNNNNDNNLPLSMPMPTPMSITNPTNEDKSSLNKPSVNDSPPLYAESPVVKETNDYNGEVENKGSTGNVQRKTTPQRRKGIRRNTVERNHR